MARCRFLAFLNSLAITTDCKNGAVRRMIGTVVELQAAAMDGLAV
jgi:hypothetical protein